MKKIKYLFVIFLLGLLSVSCNNDDDNSNDGNDSALIGTWKFSELVDGEGYEVMLTFNSNNSGLLVTSFIYDGETESESMNFTWSTNGNKLTYNLAGQETVILRFSITGNKLSITDEDGFVTVLTKV